MQNKFNEILTKINYGHPLIVIRGSELYEVLKFLSDNLLKEIIINTKNRQVLVNGMEEVVEDINFSIMSYLQVNACRELDIYPDIITGFESMPDLDFSKYKCIFIEDFLPERTMTGVRDASNHIHLIELMHKLRFSIVTMVDTLPPLPESLTNYMTVIDFPRPDENKLTELTQNIVKCAGSNISLQDEKMQEIVAAGKGVTVTEFENALCHSIELYNEIRPEIVQQIKVDNVKKTGLLEIMEAIPKEELGGLDLYKKYIENRKKGFNSNKYPLLRGSLLIGPPGSGKSTAAKVTADILKVPLVKFDLATMKSSYVGESESNLRKALSIIDALSPCVVLMDEIDKALGTNGLRDQGVSSGLLGLLLSWMEESKRKHYIVATCNDISVLLNTSQGAFIRRFDDTFLVNLPNPQERKEILRIKNKKYGTDVPEELMERLIHYSGAEIEKIVIASVYDGLDSAVANVKPLYNMNKESLEAMVSWAKDNARLASTPGEPDRLKRVDINFI